MKTAIATFALLTALVAVTVPAASADVAVIGSPPPVINPYCDPKHPDPNDPIQPRYCGAWSAYYVVGHYLDNVSITDPVFLTVNEGKAAAFQAYNCLTNWQNTTCPHRLLGDLTG